ncbi:MAG TPA: hypothetical protein VKV40_08945 [Ktedonobacteraceae bacterium]|nr:hypothetical protein [Ktedonobacteraceae bacterium]
MVLFVFKLLLTPLLIGLVSLAGRRWGPAVSGWIVGLPPPPAFCVGWPAAPSPSPSSS